MKHLMLATLALSVVSLSACAVDPATGQMTFSKPVPVSADTLRADIAEGQLLCQAGPGTVAMFSASGAAILAKGATKVAVDTVCGILGSVAVSPVGAPVGSVTVALPASLSIPLKT